MLKLAICDDDNTFAENVKSFIQCHCNSFPPMDISTFYSPSALFDEIQEDQCYDIFLLDIEMPNMTGLELAREIRIHMPAVPIIFLTAHLEYSRDGYHVNALRYVSKFQIETELPEALQTAIAIAASKEMKYVTLSYYSNTIRIPYNEIIYVHRVNRVLEIVTENQGIWHNRIGINAFLNQLDDPRFILIERSFFVNLDYIIHISGSEIFLKNGARLPVSRKLIQSVKSTILDLWGANK